ncbi:ArsR/SmtB family transcription factor [Schinkia azotoformans]|uniref:ArsR/SmtB family transcription factor n=1 Tax=Schinkia azotoformans TaxID=1454 RepID=UPI002DB7F669|nr:metalloregulator ArsR/SmtB family transcription factor [Schinkia azotoformans]MEC1718909.1 metalloregulator ArsR/SmtB family transcription factor [Schinkia azotoformans]MED4412879.1 metalloregulator ArsR/SmtB family transcription factor [Schinkia azotoformans]
MQQTTVEIVKAAQVLKLLGDKTRLTIISVLQKQECCVCELVELFEMSQPSISQHLRKLKDAGLVAEERKGQWIYYSLNKSSEFYPLIENILQHVHDQNENIEKLDGNNTKLRFDC